MRTSSDYICNSISERLFDIYLAQIFNSIPKSFLICQIQYWIKIKAKEPDKFKNSFHDDKIWVYNSYSGWQKIFPFMGKTTIRRSLNELEDDGILLSANYNKWEHDKTKWYTIDFEKLDKIVSEWYAQNGHTLVQNGHTPMSETDIPYVQNGQSNTKITTIDNFPYTSSKNSSYEVYNGFSPEEEAKNRTLSENSPIDYGILHNQLIKACESIKNESGRYVDLQEVEYIIQYYYREYKRKTHRYHPKLKQQQIERVVYGIIDGTGVVDGYNASDYEKMIDKHFKTNYPKGTCDFNIIQFMTSDAMRNYRYYETVYSGADSDEDDEEELPFA